MSTRAVTPHEQWIPTDFVPVVIALVVSPHPGQSTSNVSIMLVDIGRSGIDSSPGSLLCRTAESPHNKTIDGDIDRYAGEVQRSDEAERLSGLFQALLGQAAELPEPRLNERK